MRRAFASLFVLLSLLVAVPTTAGLNHWTPIGPYGGEIQVLAADPQQNAVVYAGTRGGVYRSTDGGATWRRTSRGLKGLWIYALAVAPSNRAVVYAGTAFGVYVSGDAGETWQGPRLAERGILSLAVDPRDAHRVWAGTDQGIAWSRDGGSTWTFADPDFRISRVPHIAIDPVRPDTVYAANSPVEDESVLGILKTRDAGATWTLVADNGLEMMSYAYDSMRVGVDPTSPNIVYISSGTAGFPPYTFRSADGGATWSETPGGYPVAVDQSGVVYAGRLRSLDHGLTWQEGAGLPSPPVDYAIGKDRVWAGTFSDGVLLSLDHGATWKASSQGLASTTVSSIAIDPDLPRVIYAAVAEMGVRKTLSSGLRWRSAHAGLPPAIHHHGFYLLAVDPAHPQTVYAAWSDGFARSDDGGAHWISLGSNQGSSLYGLAVDPAGSVYLFGQYLFGGSCRVARSDDRGATFRCLPPFAAADSWQLPSVRLFLVPDEPSTIWVLEGRVRLWKSTDRGEHWTSSQPLGLGRAGDPRSLAFDPKHPGRVYLGTDSTRSNDRPERVWRSDDGGHSWYPWGKGMPAASLVTHLLIDPDRPSVFYAAVFHLPVPGRKEDLSGVYWSRDGGRTFKPLRDGLPGGAVLDLVMDPSDPRKLYAATAENGIYTFTRK